MVLEYFELNIMSNIVECIENKQRMDIIVYNIKFEKKKCFLSPTQINLL